MVSPHAKHVANTTMVSAGPRASMAKVSPSLVAKEREMARTPKEKAKGKAKTRTRAGFPHQRVVRSVARKAIMPRTVFNATKDRFNKLRRSLDPQVRYLRLHQLVEANGCPNRVAAVEERERSTPAETELIRATMGISSANQQGQARCLLDTGADEHICPASFASWIKPESRTSGPRLRDAQGKVMQHGNNYRKIKLCVKTVGGMQLSIPVTFLIGPVQQPIISTWMGPPLAKG